MRGAYYGGTRKGYKKRKRRKRHDWHRSEFNNPFFSKSQTINLKPYLYFLLISTIILVFSYFFLFSDYWQINSVIIETQNQEYHKKIQKIIDNTLNSKIFKILNGKNYFLFNSNEVKTEIENELLIRDLKIDKKIPNEIIVNFDEITPFYIWIQDENFYNIDENGMILNEIISIQYEFLNSENKIKNESEEKPNIKKIKKFLQNSDANLNLPIIYNESELVLKRKEFIKNNEIFEFIKDLASQITQIIDVDIILYKVNTDHFNKVELITESGWKIFFSTENNLKQQYENLYTLMQKTLQNTQPLEYIDLRYGNKIYYK